MPILNEYFQRMNIRGTSQNVGVDEIAKAFPSVGISPSIHRFCLKSPWWGRRIGKRFGTLEGLAIRGLVKLKVPPRHILLLGE